MLDLSRRYTVWSLAVHDLQCLGRVCRVPLLSPGCAALFQNLNSLWFQTFSLSSPKPSAIETQYEPQVRFK